MNFTNKLILVTGAGSGIGEAIAKSFAKLSAKLALLDKNADTLNKVKYICEDVSNKKVLDVVADLGHDEDINRAVDDIYSEYGRIDVLVNCAGILGTGGILDTNLLESYDNCMKINLRSIVAITQRVTPILIENKGCIVNISSIVAKQITESIIPYSLAKAGLSNFTKCVALELASKGVRSNCILPGATKSNLLLNFGMSQEENDNFYDTMKENNPLNKIINAEEVAELVTFLSSENARSITGSEFIIDSGSLLSGYGKANGILKNSNI